jgi:hypothetical protein
MPLSAAQQLTRRGKASKSSSSAFLRTAGLAAASALNSSGSYSRSRAASTPATRFWLCMPCRQRQAAAISTSAVPCMQHTCRCSVGMPVQQLHAVIPRTWATALQHGQQVQLRT